jgi:hypothetical protein
MDKETIKDIGVNWSNENKSSIDDIGDLAVEIYKRRLK